MQVQTVLHKLMKKTCPTMHKNRREALEATVLAAITGRRLNVTDLGRSIKSQTSQKHNIKRADRLLSNPYLHTECESIYHQLCHQLIGEQKQPVILVDWSDMDGYKQHFLLRAALTVEGRTLTLYEQVHTIKTKEKRCTHQTFLEQLKCLLPADCKPVVITDAGFRTTWFKQIEALGWNWVGRIRNRHHMRWKQGGKWFHAKRCYEKATKQPKLLGEGLLTRRHQLACQFIVYRRSLQGRKHKNQFGDVTRSAHSLKQSKGQREPWLLATSLQTTSTLAKKVVRLYRLRMQIEESFRDMKSPRYGLSLNLCRTRSCQRLQVMLLIAALALMVLWLLGMASILLKRHYQYQANTVRHKKVHSIIFIGRLVAIEDNRPIASEAISSAWEQLQFLSKKVYEV